jgi:adenylate cyclase
VSVTEPERPPITNEEFKQTLLGTHPDLVRTRRVMRHLPSDPRCKVCLAPQGGIGGPIVQAFGFGRYPRNPQLCNNCYRQAVRHPGGAELEISVVFADVRGSTGLAERVGPVEFSRLLDGFYRAASTAVRRPGGVVDRLLGDGIMALFIPGFVPGGDHAGAAVTAAREILGAVDLPVGAGAHTGEAWVGFVGGENEILEFTALGDAVNTASRMGSAASAGELLISDTAARGSRTPTESLEGRRLELRGRVEPLDAWAEQVAPAPTPAG